MIYAHVAILLDLKRWHVISLTSQLSTEETHLQNAFLGLSLLFRGDLRFLERKYAHSGNQSVIGIC